MANSAKAAELAAATLEEVRREWREETERLIQLAIVSIMVKMEVTALRISYDKIVEANVRYAVVREFTDDGKYYSLRLVERNPAGATDGEK